MKKFIAILLSIFCVNAFAAPGVINIDKNNLKSIKDVSMHWQISRSSDTTSISNYTSSTLKVIISVDQTIGNAFPGRASDAITVTCNASTFSLPAGGSAICELDSTASANISDQSFQNGATGTYTILE